MIINGLVYIPAPGKLKPTPDLIESMKDVSSESNPEVARQMASILIHLLTHQFQLDPSAEEKKESSNWTLPILQQK